MNLLFNKNIFKNFNQVITRKKKNILMNGFLLPKITNVKNNCLFDKFDLFNIDEIQKHIQIKNKWLKTRFKDKILKLNSNIISKEINFTLEKFFYHSVSAILDLLLFVKKINPEEEVNIYLDSYYNLSEYFVILFSISLLNHKFQTKCKVFIIQKDGTLKLLKKIDEIRNQIRIYNFEVNHKIQAKSKFSKTAIILENAIKNKDFFFSNFRKKYHNFILFRSKDSSDSNFLKKISKKNKHFISSSIKLFNKNKNIYHNFKIIEDFYSEIVFKFFINEITDFEKNIKFFFNKISNTKINIYTSSAPLFEGIAIINFFYKRKMHKHIFLLPHAGTSVNKFHPKTYNKNFTYFKSKYLIKENRYLKNLIYKKEILINEATKKFKKNKILILIKLYNLIKNKKIFSILTNIFLNFKIKRILFFNYISNLFIKKKKIRIGIILNVECYEFLSITSFNMLYKAISLLISAISKEYSVIIKTKPGWSNIIMLSHFLKENSNYLFFNNNKNIKEFCNHIDFAVCLTDSSAIFDMIRYGVPCVLFKSNNYFKNEERFIISKKILPIVNENELLEILKKKKKINQIRGLQNSFFKNCFI
jgi:hypothetical protein